MTSCSTRNAWAESAITGRALDDLASVAELAASRIGSKLPRSHGQGVFDGAGRASGDACPAGAVWSGVMAASSAGSRFSSQTGPASRLESSHNNLTASGCETRTLSDDERLVIANKRCRCRTCKVCGRKLGWKVRQRLQDRVQEGRFKKPVVLTLTVDREGTTVPADAANVAGFGTPVQAHRYVTENSLVPRLMRSLGVKTWVAVLEFQSATGAGWPHWHILYDASELPALYVKTGYRARRTRPSGDGWRRVPNAIDLAKAWRLWRDRWGVGGLDLQARVNHRINNAAHAVNYITKYLQKQPEGGYPQWVLKSRKRVRFLSAARSLGRLVSDEDDGADAGRDEEPDERSVGDCLLARMSACGERSTLLLATADAEGVQRMRWVGDLDMGVGNAAERLGVSCSPGRLAQTTDDKGRVETAVVAGDLGAVMRWLGEAPHAQKAAYGERVVHNRKRLLAANKFSRRASLGSVAGGASGQEESEEPEKHSEVQ